jgi:hypothetical protein
MAGLLDIFGTSGADTMGLLGMSQADIARNREDAQAQALYALAGRLFQGGNTGQSIVEGLQQGQKAYRGGMQETLQNQLQNVQLQDMIRKRQQEQQALAEQQRIQGVIQGAVTKPQEIYGEDMMGNQVGAGMTAPSFDLQRAVPQLMGTAEGRKTLSELVAAQKAMRPEGYTLGEGQVRYEIGADGKPMAVAQGAPKREPVPSAIAEYKFAQDQGYKGSFQDFEIAKRAAAAPKLAVDLKDPTAVAKAQSDVLKDWRGVVKDTGAMEVADRFKAAKAAVIEGNSGNKAADGALIYAIGKIYDPSGAVQEGDKATILGNRSIPQSIKAYAERALNGQSLLPEERTGLLSVASKVVESKARNLEAQKAPYTSISQQLGGNGALLLNPLAEALTAPVERPTGMPSLADIQAEIARRKKEVNK